MFAVCESCGNVQQSAMYVRRKRTETVDASVHGSKEAVIPMHDDVLEKQTFALSRSPFS